MGLSILFVQKMEGISGSELYLMQILPELKKRGYSVSMLIIHSDAQVKNEKFTEFLNRNDVKVHEIYGHSAISPILFYKIAKLIKQGNYDIIQPNLVHANFWIAAVKAMFNRKLKIISVKHGYDPKYQTDHGADISHLKTYKYYWIEWFTSLFTNFNITISKGLYSIFVDGKITRAAKTQNIYYGVSLEPNLQNNNDDLLKKDTYVLITGRLVNFKGHRYLIDAWKIIQKTHPSLKLYIAGDGDKRKELEQQVAALQLNDSIRFLGHTPNPHPYMANSIFTVVSSISEGFGLITLESWLHRKPVVAFDAPAMNEIIDDKKNGLLAKSKDSEDLAEKIIYLYENPDLIKKYGDDGYRKLMEFYNLDRMTSETEEVYKSIASL